MYAIEVNEPVLIFRVGPIYVSTPVRVVDSIVSTPPVNVFPGQAPSIIGVFRYRESTIPVLDLHHKFGLQNPQEDEASRVIVSSSRHGMVGFRVDEVLDIVQLEELEWSQAPRFISGNVFDSTLQWNNHMVLSTDFDRLFSMPDASPLSEWAKEHGLLDDTSIDEQIAVDPSGSDHIVDIPTQNALEVVEETSAANEIALQESTEQEDVLRLPMAEPESELVQDEENTATVELLNSKLSESGEYADQEIPELEDIAAEAGKLGDDEEFVDNYPVDCESRNDEFNDKEIIHIDLSAKDTDTQEIEKTSLDLETNAELEIEQTSMVAQTVEVSQFSSETPAEEREIKDESTAVTLEQTEIADDKTKGEAKSNRAIVLLIPGVIVLLIVAIFTHFYTSDMFGENTSTENKIATSRSSVEAKITREAIVPDAAETGVANVSSTQASVVTNSNEGPNLTQEPVVSDANEKEFIQSLDSDEKSGLLEEDHIVEAVVDQEMITTQASSIKQLNNVEATSASLPSVWATHVVVKGDTLWRLSHTYLGTPWRYPELADWSNILNPDLIYPGDKVRYEKSSENTQSK